MKISSICIDRPIFAIVLNTILVLIGLLSFQFIAIQFTPTVFKPVLSINTNYPGASAEVIQNSITQPLVAAASGTYGLSYIEATSMQGLSYIKLNFGNISEEKFLLAQSQLMRNIASVTLPDGAQPPSIQQRDKGSTLVFIGFSDKSKSVQDIASYVNDTILKQLLQIPGVANVDLWADTSALRVKLDPKKLSALKISPIDIATTLDKLTEDVSAGQIITNANYYTINITSALGNINDFKNTVIAKKGNKLIRLDQVARIYMGSLSISGGSQSTINAEPGVILGLSATSDANPILVASKVNKTLQDMESVLPPGMHAKVLLNFANPLKISIYEVIKTIFEAIFLVALVSFLFLGRLKAALIPIVTLPVCLISVFTIIWILGFSINMMTLLALVLAVGLVVDDAIVVLENCYRHIQKGIPAIKAAHIASKEISFAIIGMTVTLIAVYMPIAFMTGKSAVYFKEFAFTLAACILISGFVALTLSPSMCAHNLNIKKQGKYELFVANVFRFLERIYQKSLHFILGVKTWMVILFIICSAFGWLLFTTIPSALTPKDSIGVAGMYISGQNNTSIKSLQKELSNLSNLVVDEKYIANKFSTIFIDNSTAIPGALMFFVLKPNKTSDTNVIVSNINKIIESQKDLNGGGFAIPLGLRSGSFGSGDIQFYLIGMLNINTIYSNAIKFSKLLEKLPAVQSADVAGNIDSAQFQIKIDFVKAAKLGVPGTQIQILLNILLGGKQLVNEYKNNNQSYPIILQLPKTDLKNFNSLSKMYLQSDNKDWIQLSRLITITPIVRPPLISTYNQMNNVEIDVNLKPGHSMGSIISQIKSMSKQDLPPGISIVFKGEAKDMLAGNLSMIIIFLAGIIFVYLILAALFESFVDPFIILLTVPLCVVGALLGLKLIGGSLNIYTQIGLITLVGLVSKHGILIVQFSNSLLAKNIPLQQAIIEGASTRLRPILMTTATMILGALPLVFATGIGEHAREQIGIVIVAGLFVGSFFSLFVVPVAYYICAGLRNKIKY